MGMPRITAGQFRGRPLATPSGRQTRPTSDKARQAVFNILMHAPWSPFADGARPRTIDLFAGSGALGFEALSRGASFCLFVETEASARGAIRDNIEAFGAFGITRLHRRDATALGPKPAGMGAAYDLVFLDPPYQKHLLPPALHSLHTGGWLAPGAIVVLELGSDEDLILAPPYEQLDRRSYGAAQVVFARYAADH